MITSVRLEKSEDLDYGFDQMVRGHCLLILEEQNCIYIFNASKINARSPEEPSNEKVVRGSHAGFVENLEKSRLENYINLSILDIKRDFHVIEKNGSIHAKIKLSINLGVNEYPKDHLDNKKKLKVLDQHIENQFTTIADRTISKLHAANCDGLGLGLRVKSKYPEIWKKMNWNNDYPTIPIDVDIESTIVDNGIINYDKSQ
ncbi:hypothetical protein ABE65_011045 [Fictibacillus phosphorivorans]|uniref:Spore germination GerAC-like C-terminal domain-containing protein n=1 Tax=Fictibacillus phosphorivorans TaxID=1221500 RepID=A0A161IJ20_9BACL|nr:Ger(x)C family spore germination C-terminal domain-containing protein [Fictibacillus phosphorivorans]ANC77309.1 hypothetical protein ABE65_011045 [Fictibacillus phosphorivorans]